MPNHIDPALFFNGPANGTILFDDFDSGGALTTGSATIATATVFGIGQWRAALINGAPSIDLVQTGANKDTQGVVQLATGTNTAGIAGFIRSASFAPTAGSIIFGTGQTYCQKWRAWLPTPSDGAQTFLVQLGYLSGLSATPSDGAYFEFGSGNFGALTRKASVSTPASGGTNVPVVAGQIYTFMITWDGTTMRFYVDDVLIGSSTTNIPIVPVGEGVRIAKSAGALTRTFLIDYFWQYKQWSISRGA